MIWNSPTSETVGKNVDAPSLKHKVEKSKSYGVLPPQRIGLFCTNQRKTWAKQHDLAAQETQGDLRQGSLCNLVERRWRWMPNPKGEITSFLIPQNLGVFPGAGRNSTATLKGHARLLVFFGCCWVSPSKKKVYITMVFQKGKLFLGVFVTVSCFQVVCVLLVFF